MENIIFDTTQARYDTYTAIPFLTTTAREPNNDHWAELLHLIKYIKGTRNLQPILSANRIGILKWWIDGSLAVHPNMIGNTGGVLSI